MKRKYFLPGFITLVAGLVIFIFKGIWPFGSLRIDYFDNMQQVAPLYCHLWDWMHGKASLWFDWYTGLGTNVSMSISAFSMLSPFNILLYFIPREYILEFISILTLVKMMVMATSMYALINYRYEKLAYSMKVLFSVMYAFCGYSIVYASCFTPWMDVVALFPLLILACDYLVKTGKKLFYILMVGLIFIINYYLGAMSLIYVFMAYGISMVTRVDRKEWKKHAWNIGIGTIAGIALSAFVLLPVFAQLSTSQRSASSESLVKQYFGWITAKTFKSMSLGMVQRVMMLYGMAFILIVIIAGLRKCKRDLAHFGYYVAMLVLVIAPVLCEGTNLMWHFGSYNGYTLRMGYVIAFTLLCLAAELGQDMFVFAKPKKKQAIIQAVAVFVGCVAYAIGYHLMPRMKEKYALWFFIAVFAVFFISYLIVLVKRKWSINPYSLIGLVVLELFMGAFAFIGPPKFYKLAPYQYGDYVEYANEAKEKLQIEESVTDRITNPDISLNANYPLVLDRGAQSSFTAALLSDTQEHSLRLGYSKYFLWLLDSGGTVFTDAMLHVTEAVNSKPLESEFYALRREADTEFKLYSAVYQLPFAMKVDKSILSEKSMNSINNGKWIELNNIFYKALSSDKDNLVDSYSLKKSDKGINYVEYKFDVKGQRAVYFAVRDKEQYFEDVNFSKLFKRLTFYVNGEPVIVPTIGNLENTTYPVDYNNNLIYLGLFEDETVTVKIQYKTDKFADIDDLAEISVGGLDLDKLDKLCKQQNQEYSVEAGKSSLKVTYNETDSQGGCVMLPVIMNDDNWTVKVDGKKVKAVNVGGLFTCIEVEGGEHEIEMIFDPKGRSLGLMISLATLLIIILCVVIDRIKSIKVPVFFEKCAVSVYSVLFVALVIGMFIIPVICSVIVDILQIFGIK